MNTALVAIEDLRDGANSACEDLPDWLLTDQKEEIDVVELPPYESNVERYEQDKVWISVKLILKSDLQDAYSVRSYCCLILPFPTTKWQTFCLTCNFGKRWLQVLFLCVGV